MNKTDCRMELRGKLDSLNAHIIFMQTLTDNTGLTADLEELRAVVRTLQRCEATGGTAGRLELWGMDEDEIHTRSHNPRKYYGLGHILPCREMGRDAAMLNVLRTLVREAELCSCRAFPDDTLNICHVLNRLSSAVYVMIYRYLPKGFCYELKFS